MDSADYRKALGSFATGVTVVTTCDAGGAPWGVTASSFASVSLDPPLISVCIARAGRTYPVLSEAGRFAVNILSSGQVMLARRFSHSHADRFEGVDWTREGDGGPRLPDSTAVLDCRMHRRVDAGDHAIFLGLVEDFHLGALPPLGYARGRFFAVPLGHKG